MADPDELGRRLTAIGVSEPPAGVAALRLGALDLLPSPARQGSEISAPTPRSGGAPSLPHLSG